MSAKKLSRYFELGRLNDSVSVSLFLNKKI